MKLSNDFVFSQSNLQDYVNCPYLFYLRHKLNLDWPALQTEDAIEMEAHMLSGARFHRLAQQYFLGIPFERLQAMSEADPNPNLAIWWQNFMAYIAGSIKGIPYAELTLLTNLSYARLIAKYDLVVIDQDFLTIYDWKTSLKPAKRAWLLNRLQTRVYLYLLAREHKALLSNQIYEPNSLRMIYWQANYPEAPQTIAYTQAAYQADEAYLMHLIQEIQTTSDLDFFKTNNTGQCKYCIYRSLCERGIQAGIFTELEADLEEIDPQDFIINLDQIDEIAF